MIAFLCFIFVLLGLAAGFRAGRHHERTLAASARSVVAYKAADTRRTKRRGAAQMVLEPELSNNTRSQDFNNASWIGEGAES